MVVENKVLIKVVFPRPDSPATWSKSVYLICLLGVSGSTMMVNAAPRLATILCLDPGQSRLDRALPTSQCIYLWFGSYPVQRMSANTFKAYTARLTLAMPIGEAASDIAGAILRLDIGYCSNLSSVV